MAPRRGPPSANALSPQDPLSHSSSAPSPAFLSFPRANSPSSGFTHFLSKPSKWFNRNSSNTRLPQGSSEPRSSSSTSSGRKPKISSPTDPRPLVSSLQSDTYVASAARSVLDLSSTRLPASLDMPAYHFPGASSSPPSPSAGLGDLRNISRRAWSKSADDLGKMSPGGLPPINTSFQHKITQYRNRTNSNASGLSPASTSSPVVSTNLRHPFPGLKPSFSPGSSPPRCSVDHPSVSISVSAPSVESDAFLGSGPPAHVHIRSHSFTPRLPSKLTPRFGPSSPKRKGSGGSDRDLERDPEIRDVEKYSNGSTSSPVSVNRGPFPFGFSGAHVSKPMSYDLSSNPAAISQTSVRSTVLQPPPTIIEPTQTVEEEDKGKRASQIVYHSGFINLQSNMPPALLQYSVSRAPHSNLTLAKGWKPYKLELKGSKLLFYKPPGDRTAAIKDLFPSGLVPVLEAEEASLADDSDGKNRRIKESTLGRKKRAYWGRRTHPDLVHSKGQVQNGTLEALVHEAVFATTFPNPPASVNDIGVTNTGDADIRKEDWKGFASAVLLCLPPLIGQDKFENEFTRCCDYLISGADDSVKETESARVGWLAGEYLRYQGPPADRARWDEWRAETIPNESAAFVREVTVRSIPNSSSTQALYAPTPQIGFESPNIGTFSPRPHATSRILSLVEALGVPSESPQLARKSSIDFYSKTGPGGSQIPWASLEQEGLSREILFSLDPRLVARSLCLFHRSVLELTPENVSADLVIGTRHGDTTDDDLDHAASFFKILFGSEEQPHWLTRLVLLQILSNDTTSSSGGVHVPGSIGASTHTFDERHIPTSRTHSRSDVISVWVKIGELCRLAGDECSWRAIAAALCSRPVARLDKAWKRVDVHSLAAVEAWVYSGPDGECASINEPRMTPWGGEVKSRIEAEMAKAGVGDEEGWSVGPFRKIRDMFNELRTAFSLCPRRVMVTDDGGGEDVQRMVGFWSDMAAGDGSKAAFATKFTRVDQFMSLSLAAEPRRKGLYEPLFWSRSTGSQNSRDALIPLLFPEPLPAVTFMDRGLVSRNRSDGDSSEFGVGRGIDGHLHPERWQRQPMSGTFLGQGGVFFGGVKYGGTMIPVYDGELLLVVQQGGGGGDSSVPSSRPPSSVLDQTIPEKPLARAPSFRVKAGSSHGVERKSSTARRNSLPAISHRQSFVTTEPSSEPPLRVLVQAGSLDRLVNILAHGLQNVSVSVADDNGEMALREGKTRELIVDRVEFARVWWGSFRSFVTPSAFFELVRKLYVRSQPQSSSPSIGEYLTMARDRSEVLGTLKEWLSVGGGAQDALDDSQLFAAMTSFLEEPTDHIVAESPSFGEPAVRQAWRALQQARDGLVVLFSSQTKRPPRAVNKQVAATPRHRKVVQDVTDIDEVGAEQLVDYLDGMASATFGHVTEEDLLVTSDLLEVQTADRIGWLPNREVNWNDEVVEIQTIYSHLREAQPSSLISELGPETLYRLLPPSVRSCIRAYGILRKWLIMKLVAPNLGIRARQARMDLFLRAIEVARMRNADSAGTTPGTAGTGSGTGTGAGLPRPRGHVPCVRSFVEALVSAAVLSVESRAHQRAWQSLAAARGVQCDSLTSLLAKPVVQMVDSKEQLTVDIGWVIERMLEIMTAADTIESLSEEAPQMLANYNKRRHLCSLIMTAPSQSCSRWKYQKDGMDRSATELLNDIEREVHAIQFDIRAIKEEAHREAMHSAMNGISSNKKFARPFLKIVVLQVEKNKRDRTLRDRLIKEKRLEDTRGVRREDLFNKAMRPRKMTELAQKQRRSKKSMSSAFMQFMRPISSAFTSDTLHVPGPRKSPTELDFVPTVKPSLVVSLVEARVVQFINNERSFTFQLDTEDGGRYLLQAVDKRDMAKWIETIGHVAKMTAKRRLTYVGNSPKPQPSDHIYTSSMTSSRDPVAVFGVELNFLLKREAQDGEVQPGTIPSVLERCLSEVESRGLSEVGIYRIAGASSEINALRDGFNRGESPINRSTDIHAVCDLVKYWFRVLPEPVFPPSSYFSIIEAMKLENFDLRLSKTREIVQALPQANFDILKRVAEHLDKVTDYEENNQMTADALSIVFSPNLLRAPQNDFVTILANMGHTHKLVKALITHFNAIFEDADPEAEFDQEEDEYDLPTLAEDEDEDELDEGSQAPPVDVDD